MYIIYYTKQPYVYVNAVAIETVGLTKSKWLP